MDSITFKNFRQFKDETTFDLRNINILVGKNNSGKSTLTKGLRLYLFNIKNLKFAFSDNIFSYRPFFLFGGDAIDNPHIGTFGRALSWGSEYDFIVFSARFEHISIETTVARFFNNGEGKIMDYYHESSAPISCIKITDEKMSAHYVFDFEKESQIIEIDARENSMCYKTWRKEIEEVKKNPGMYSRNDEFKVKRLEKCLDFNIKEKIRIEIPLQKKHHQGSLYPSLLSNAFGCCLDYDVQGEGEKEKQPLLYKMKNEEAIEDFIGEVVIGNTGVDIERILKIEQIEFVEAHSITHSLVYNVSDRNDYMAHTILNYLNENFKNGNSEKEFVKEWMMKLEIGKDFLIESIGGECFKLGIIEDLNHPDAITPLLDKGVGSNQIMILLLRLATIMHKYRGATYPPMLIIEEPEQNLHPKMQSLLADLFKEVYLYPQKVNKFSRGVSFVIETHSEYLVRKSQVLVAERKQTEANPFTVFYTETGKRPRQIRYNSNGVFCDNFGDGFFDEASERALDLLKFGGYDDEEESVL